VLCTPSSFDSLSFYGNASPFVEIPLSHDKVTSLVAPNSESTTFHDMQTTMKAHYKGIGMPNSLLGRKLSETFIKKDANDLFGVELYANKPIIKRGRWYCTHNSCRMNIPFSFYKKPFPRFKLLKNGNGEFCLNHSHTLEAARLTPWQKGIDRKRSRWYNI
jgi:hypothetical protein